MDPDLSFFWTTHEAKTLNVALFFISLAALSPCTVNATLLKSNVLETTVKLWLRISQVLDEFELTLLGLEATQTKCPCKISVVFVNRGRLKDENSFAAIDLDLGHACLAASMESIMPHKW